MVSITCINDKNAINCGRSVTCSHTQVSMILFVPSATWARFPRHFLSREKWVRTRRLIVSLDARDMSSDVHVSLQWEFFFEKFSLPALLLRNFGQAFLISGNSSICRLNRRRNTNFHVNVTVFTGLFLWLLVCDINASGSKCLDLSGRPLSHHISRPLKRFIAGVGESGGCLVAGLTLPDAGPVLLQLPAASSDFSSTLLPHAHPAIFTGVDDVHVGWREQTRKQSAKRVGGRVFWQHAAQRYTKATPQLRPILHSHQQAATHARTH